MLKSLYQKCVVKDYINVGRHYGDALSYYFMGKPIGFDSLEQKFIKLQLKICKLGYLPYSLDELISHGGYGVKLPELEKNPSPYRLAKRLKQNGLGAKELRSFMQGDWTLG